MRKRKLTPRAVRTIRAAFEAGGMRAAARAAGLSATTLYRRRAELGLVRRPGRPADRRPAGFEPAPEGTPLRERLERLVAHRIEALEAEAANGAAIDPDANARAVAANTRTLALLRRLPPDTPAETAPDDEPPPRSLGELRDELRRHLERIADEERSRRLPFGAEPDGDGPDAGALADPLPDGPAPA